MGDVMKTLKQLSLVLVAWLIALAAGALALVPGASTAGATTTKAVATRVSTKHDASSPRPPAVPGFHGVDLEGTPSGQGYWIVNSSGCVTAYGDAVKYNDMCGQSLQGPVVGMTVTPSGHGYWLFASDGGIFAFGDAPFIDNALRFHPNGGIVGMAATHTGNGYWLLGGDGGIFAFGDAGFFGNIIDRGRMDAAGIVAAPNDQGYWILVHDGGIFSKPDGVLPFYGNACCDGRNWVAIAATHSGHGYWLEASDGTIKNLGDAGQFGNMGGHPLNEPMIALSATPTDKGYWQFATDAGLFAWGDAAWWGAPNPPTGPAGYSYAVSEGQHVTISGTADVAFGANGQFFYKQSVSGGIDCTNAAFGGDPIPGVTKACFTKPSSSSRSTLAQQLLSNSRVDKSGRCVSADLQDAAANKVSTGGTYLSARLLNLLVNLGQSHSFTISAIESCGTGHASGSRHYTGDAVDISRVDGHVLQGRDTYSRLAISIIAPLMPSGSRFGQKQCGTTPPLPAGITTFNDTCNHLHSDVPRGTP
jgi:hypothetical protein